MVVFTVTEDSMRLVPIILGSLAFVAGGVRVAAKVQDKKESEKRETLLVVAETAKFKEVIPGVSRAVLSGDPDKGAYRAFTKFAPGAMHPLHWHSSDIYTVVLKGAYLYKPEKGEEKRVGPGSYLFIPAGDRHTSSCDPKDGLLMFEESPGKFDMTLVEKK
jgi:quercetin dioxygenase-like cupin family protein